MFTVHKHDSVGITPWEYLPAAAGEYKVGQALNVADGQLAATGAIATTPAYICMAEKTVKAGEILPVIRVRHDLVFESQLSAEKTDLAIGDKLSIAADSLTAAAEAGTFEVVGFEDTGKGAKVYGRFN